MAYKCLPLCGLFSFFKGFSENLFHAGFQFIQIEGRTLHRKTENFLLFRVGEIALIVLEHSLPCIQNFPEGAIISMPLRAEGMKKGRAFWGGVLSGIVEPIGAVLTILAAGIVVPALPYLLSFAAGAMLYVVVEELIPEMSQGQHSNVGTVLFCGGLQRDDGAGRSTGGMVGGRKRNLFQNLLNSLTEETAGRIILAEGPQRSGFL